MPQPLPNLSESVPPKKKLVILQKLLAVIVIPELEETVPLEKHNKEIPRLNKSSNISMETNNFPEKSNCVINQLFSQRLSNGGIL